jgi:thymidylate synthase (FAD)
MKVSLVAVSHPLVEGVNTAEDLIVYCARVSSPQNQLNLDTGARLLAYCIRKGHWSVFEQADMTLEIETSRAITQQIIRHRSFTFQEFSQRYAPMEGFEPVSPRRQDASNRQSSHNDLPRATIDWFSDALCTVEGLALERYEEALRLGVAKESARFLLPMTTRSRIYMKGSVRSWLHYFGARLDPATQKEHRDVAIAGFEIFKQQFPTVAEAYANEQ